MCKGDPISDEEEERLCPWSDGSFGMSSSTTMQCNVFFSTTANCLVFQSQMNIKIWTALFKLGIDNTGRFTKFIGRKNKTFKGRLGHLHLNNEDINTMVLTVVNLHVSLLLVFV